MLVGAVWMDRDVDSRIAVGFLDAFALVFRLATTISVRDVFDRCVGAFGGGRYIA